MSTTFEVLPGSKYIPTFEELISLSNTYVNSFLQSLGIDNGINIKVNLHKKDESVINDDMLLQRVHWEDDFYAWFFVDGITGGTDTYFWVFDEKEYDIRDDDTPQIRKYTKEVTKSYEIGYRWSFRRSAGQPGIIVLSYGLIAAALAKLTDGLIYSDDGAWDFSKFPAKPEEFLSWYFRPELTIHTESKEWAESCIALIHRDLVS